MKKYNIEGGIDFFNELYKSLDNDENIFKTEEDDNCCLITKQPLVKNYITMICGHKFNYIPLYNDIKNHKQKYNNMEVSINRLKPNEIRCPYCRVKQSFVLPYYEDLGLEKIHGVNFYDSQVVNIQNNNYNVCNYLTPNISYDPSGNNPVEFMVNSNDNGKYYKCLSMGTKINYNKSGTISTNFGDDKYYCYCHKNIVIKKYKIELSEKIKEEKKQAKIKAKEEKINSKILEKQKLIEEKQKLKEEKQKAKEELINEVKKGKISKKSSSFVDDVENTVISSIDINNKQLCSVILKTGINKGNACGGKIVNNNLCKRHCKINIKINNKIEI
jgi:hypothetical protein